MKHIVGGMMLAASLFVGMLVGGCAPGADTASPSSTGDVVATDLETDEDSIVDVPAPSNAGKLHVEGAHLVSEAGQTVQLRGVSTHGLAWFPQYVNQQFFNELRHDWGANVVRLALYTAESGGYCTGGDQRELEQLVRDGVAYAQQADLYALVDWHVLADQDPNAHAAEARAFFDKMSKEFASADNVLYEICNEPNGGTTWEQVTAYADEIIPVIRANDADAVIIVGTPTWSQDIDKAAAAPLSFDNVMYALHFYAATHQQDLRDRLRTAVEGGLPVFVTEFGICDASGNGAIDYASADAWVALMDELDVSYICWNLSNKNESSALFKPECGKTAEFTESDLSAEGRWLASVLQSAGFAGDAAASDEANAAEEASPHGNEPGLTWTIATTNSWEDGTGTCVQYALSIRNNGPQVESWEVDVPLEPGFTLQDSWNGQYTVHGDTLHIANAGYNGTIPAGTEISDIGFIVRL